MQVSHRNSYGHTTRAALIVGVLALTQLFGADVAMAQAGGGGAFGPLQAAVEMIVELSLIHI